MGNGLPREILIVYVGDNWLSTDSLRVITASYQEEDAIEVIKEYIKENELDELSKDELTNLEGVQQTHGRDDNFLIKEISINELN